MKLIALQAEGVPLPRVSTSPNGQLFTREQEQARRVDYRVVRSEVLFSNY